MDTPLKESKKYIGETTSEFSKRICDKYKYRKIAVCGKLDPMARGRMYYLADADTKLMSKYLDLNKTYEFYIVYGIKTDTDDILGLIKDINFNNNNSVKGQVQEYMNNLLTLKEQCFHPYSAKTVSTEDGLKKKLHSINKDIYNNGLPSKAIEVYSCEFLEELHINYYHYLNEVLNRIQTISETQTITFRVKDILDSWIKTSEYVDKQIIMCKYRINVSTGFYVRMITYEIYRMYNIPCHIYDIHRL